MDGKSRLTGRSSAEDVECRDELITEILTRVSTKDLLKMSTVVKRWRNLIFEPDFAHTHYKNCHQESIFIYIEQLPVPRRVVSFQFRTHKTQSGNLSRVSLSLERIDSFFFNRSTRLLASSNGLMCFCTFVTPEKILEFLVYNPVTKILKILPLPPFIDKRSMTFPFIIGICPLQSTGKLVIGGFSLDEDDTYTLVFDSQSDSWYKGPPVALFYDNNKPRNSSRHTVFLNGVIYFLVRTPSIDVQEGQGSRDVDALFRDEDGLFYKIIGYDVNQDQWCFSVFIPTSVSYPYCLFEWKGKLFILASNSTHEENLFVLAASSAQDRKRKIRYGCDEGDGHFVFWILDTEQNLWTRDRELDLSHEIHNSWEVFASGGVVWFAKGYNSVIVYHMKTRHCSTHRLGDGPSWQKLKHIPCVAFEPTLLSF
ncbi:hypothetical protein SUGI_0069630 [Cryptomeria japonica]|uniref:F-box/kelch-repeat protein At5g43190 n=1 Tax=Cryptomeria japonica TaxID=3369 RepID=UPI002408A5BC|nr:F-box/kelch-repeat protein At5g43190 [Cryptomeria japonica]GLJ07557.1 hypothetical protein SUGI_0069630 [Cryptomeria japonica]